MLIVSDKCGVIVGTNSDVSGLFSVGRHINKLSEVLVNANFVGVKTGDVNGNAQANALACDDRTLNGTFNLQAEDIELKAGNTYTVAFTGEDLSNIQGYQGTLQWS